MKQFLLISILSFCIFSAISAQSFDDAMDHYNDEQFSEAIEIFSQFNDDRSLLFTGKSHLALSEYSTANNYLNRAAQSRDEAIREEALYSLALSNFELKNYALSLENLYKAVESNNMSGLRQDARRFYVEILNYLSARERFETLQQLKTSSIRFDLVNRSRSYLESEQYAELVDELKNLTTNPATLERIESELASTSPIQTFVHPYPEAPIGKVYNVGVILPTFNETDPDFTIPRNLYFGMLIAADEFNSRNTDQKVRLLFRNSYEHPDSSAAAFRDLVESQRIDAVIGPLFSEPAVRMASIADELNIPMLPPLANSDNLNADFEFIFQMNPTLETHGKMMARYAVENLGLKQIAIMIEQDDPGKPSAISFRNEAERLGANITYFIEENFAVRGYDLSDITEVFTSNRNLADSLGYRSSEAIYAPFSGQASTTMMNLLMNDLESMRNNLTILGTETWEDATLTNFQQRFFEIYYSQPFSPFTERNSYSFFSEDFENRFGTNPDRFAMIGYDTASYLFLSLETAGNPEYTSRALQTMPEYEGVIMRVNFDGQRVNQHLFIHPMTERARQRKVEDENEAEVEIDIESEADDESEENNN
ncbi:MAG: amino acid ABC transporter substrate-binding protein [Balneolaceae bacterium]|nr:amino acid ABC transporter substrate-binding protein [Balneolaceae bacterium]